jgi:rare lipoprotein A
MSGVTDVPVKVGTPYKIGDVSYVPEDVAAYDEVGYASFYGDELAGNRTANGEAFVPSAISAAHKTLPLPSYVEVTALGTGRTILVRINDRGPFTNDRLIDLSLGAARQLGITGLGVTGVRVRKVNPPEQERAALRNGLQVSERIETPESLLRVLNIKLAKLPPRSAAAQIAENSSGSRPPVATSSGTGRFIREGTNSQRPEIRPAVRPAPMPRNAAPPVTKDRRFIRESVDAVTVARSAETSSQDAVASGYVVQLASYSSRTRADQLARSMGANVQANGNGSLYRVRFGPYATEAEAQRGLATARQRGYPQARIFRE